MSQAHRGESARTFISRSKNSPLMSKRAFPFQSICRILDHSQPLAWSRVFQLRMARTLLNLKCPTQTGYLQPIPIQAGCDKKQQTWGKQHY